MKWRVAFLFVLLLAVLGHFLPIGFNAGSVAERYQIPARAEWKALERKWGGPIARPNPNLHSGVVPRPEERLRRRIAAAMKRFSASAPELDAAADFNRNLEYVLARTNFDASWMLSPGVHCEEEVQFEHVHLLVAGPHRLIGKEFLAEFDKYARAYNQSLLSLSAKLKTLCSLDD